MDASQCLYRPLPAEDLRFLASIRLMELPEQMMGNIARRV
jgi:hypothetical protein